MLQTQIDLWLNDEFGALFAVGEWDDAEGNETAGVWNPRSGLKRGQTSNPISISARWKPSLIVAFACINELLRI